MSKRLLLPFFSSILCLTLFYSCRKDDFSTDPDYKLAFSQDTIMFDTVFTSVGSATEVFTVYNSNPDPVKISSLRLATGSASKYRLNVDGMPGKAFTDVEIGANDSIFIFVEVTIDPFETNLPFIVSDSILFETNGNLQYIDLVAFGQRAIFHRPDPHSLFYPFFLIDSFGSTNWVDSLPHVIYGYGIVMAGTTLTIDPGTLVCFHPGSALLVDSAASLHIEGTPTENVIVQGDKLQYDYTDLSGQWDRIWLTAGSKNSVIKNTIIKNGNIGLQVDTFAGPTDSTLYMENVIVKNMATSALILRGAKVSGYNCVFANCGSNVANIQYGGYYKFYHCTFANFWLNSTRQDPVLMMSNYYNNAPRGLTADFGNSIVYGNNDQELGLDSFPIPGYFNFHFDHALLKIEPSFGTSSPYHYNAIIRSNFSNNIPKFKDVSIGDYQLDTLSACYNAGDAGILNVFPAVLNSDLKGNSRLIDAPDLGAYERQQ